MEWLRYVGGFMDGCRSRLDGEDSVRVRDRDTPVFISGL